STSPISFTTLYGPNRLTSSLLSLSWLQSHISCPSSNGDSTLGLSKDDFIAPAASSTISRILSFTLFFSFAVTVSISCSGMSQYEGSFILNPSLASNGLIPSGCLWVDLRTVSTSGISSSHSCSCSLASFLTTDENLFTKASAAPSA